MEDTEELPTKRRKIEDVSKLNGDATSESDDKTAKTKTPLNLQIQPRALARLRQIAKNSNIIGGATSPQKQGDHKNDNTVVATATSNSHDQNQNQDEVAGDTAKNTNDVIISSAGSSPAHSPKPEDLTVLSTPPKMTWTKDNHLDSKAVSKKLLEEFKDPDENRDPNGESKEPCDNPVLIDDDPSEVKAVDEQKTKKVVETKSNSSTSQTPSLSLDTAELKKVLKAMIDEKFKQVEDEYHNQESETVLIERIARLEDENRSLHEYAAKLEKAVKLLLDNQKSKKDKQNKSIQTDDTGLSKVKAVPHNTPPPPMVHISQPPKQSIPATTPTLPAQSQIQINQVNKQGTQVTSRLRATQAAIPGHSVTPASLPQRATYTQQHVSVTNPTLKPPQGPRMPQYTSSVTQLGVPTSPTRRPAPVTVTVHPQTTTTTMIPSPSYPAQVQKSTYVTNTIISQPRPPVSHPHQQIQRLPSSQPMVVYQRPPAQQQAPQAVQPLQQYPNSLPMRSPPSSRPGTQVVQHQAPALNNQTRAPQNTPNNFQHVRPQIPQNMAVSPRNVLEQGNSKDLPGRPVVSIAVVSNGIVLSWNMHNNTSSTRIARYQLFALQDTNNAQWKKIGVVNALPLPMACTLTQFMPGNKYHFTVRAQDEHGRCGPLSEACTVTLT